MIQGFAMLLVLQLVGEVVVHAFVLSIPGPVLGMGLLVLVLTLANRMRPITDEQLVDSPVGRVSQALLGNLALLFVPAGVGIVQYLGLVADQGIALGVTLVISTVATLIVTVLVFLLVKKILENWRKKGMT